MLYTYTFYVTNWFGGYRHWAIPLEAVAVCAIGIFGTMECYRANGGSSGQAFLSRFSALCVPVGVKLALLNASLALFMHYGFPHIVTPVTFRDPEFVWRLSAFVLNLAVSFLFYARVVYHMSLVAKTASTAASDAA